LLVGFTWVHLNRPAKEGFTLLPVIRSKVAIVLDDWGYNLDAFEAAWVMDQPLTLAVLPSLPYSYHIALEGQVRGHEVILHMPMEPKASMQLEESTIMVGMSEKQIQENLKRSLSSLPLVRGVSNHMGSRASEDEAVMQTVLRILKVKKYYYLDSFTTPQSVAGRVGEQLNVPVLRRDVFLDNVLEEEAIQQRLDELRKIAKRKGRAIGIGHDKPLTLEMIRKNLPLFERDGIEMVKLSDLLTEESR
jgi:uncharacterized protein